jgi:hypothetical protein
MIAAARRIWARFAGRHPELRTFLVFFLVSNGVTVLQLALMPLLRLAFNRTELVDVGFQLFPVGAQVDGSRYWVFDYPAGALPDGGGGLAYFLAVELTLLVAQVINFYLQRNITFKSNTGVWAAALWYLIAYLCITLVAAAAQGFYKAPIYHFFAAWGAFGQTAADVVTMVINSAISFWVFYPVFKLIFRRRPEAA